MIEIIALNKKDLLDHIASAQFGLGEHIAISRHRARSQAVNPRAEDTDTLLLLAIEAGTLLGYLGVLPDHLFSTNEKLKVGWFSCLWVSPKARGKGISLKLMNEALKNWDHKILSADYVPFTKKIYDKTKAFGEKPYTKSGLRLYLRSDLFNLLPPKGQFFQKTKRVLKIKDAFFNLFLDFKLKFFKTNIDKYNIQHVEKIDDSLNAFLAKTNQHAVFNRTAKELNWIFENPWILSGDKDDGLSKKYHFSAVAQEFKFKALTIKDSEGNYLALLIFAKRDSSLKLPYVFHQNSLEAVSEVVNHYLIEWKIKTFTCFHAALCEVLKNNPSPAFYTKNQMRSYMVSNAIAPILFDEKTIVQDGDGDCCFT